MKSYLDKLSFLPLPVDVSKSWQKVGETEKQILVPILWNMWKTKSKS